MAWNAVKCYYKDQETCSGKNSFINHGGLNYTSTGGPVH